MILSFLGRRVGAVLMQTRCNSRCCSGFQARSIGQRTHVRAASCRSTSRALPASWTSGKLQWRLQQWNLRSLVTQSAVSASVGDAISGYEEVSGVVHMTKFDPVYVNYVALTGLLEQSMESSRTPQGNYLFTVTVFENHLPYEVLQVEASGDVAAAISSNLQLLQKGALLSVQGKLAKSQDATGRSVTKVCASLIGICEEVPESIANAAAAVAAERSSNRPMSPPVVAAGAAASAPALMPGDGGMPKVAKYPTEEMWMELFMDPGLYYDNRLTKTGRQPDFKRKHDGSALWINDGKTPAWVLDNLQLLPGAIPYTKQRTSGRRYDFMPAQPTGDKEADWCDLFNDYQQWWDNRAYKINPRGPDFKHKSDGRALWLESKDTPVWTWQNLGALPDPPGPR